MRNSTRLIVPSGSLAVAASGIAEPDANEAPAVGLVRETAGAWLPPPPPLHATPLTAKLVGLPLKLPVQRPLKPMEVLAFMPRLRFQSKGVADTFCPEELQFADQPEPSDCPLGRVKVKVQPDHGSPVFVTVRLAVKPPTPGLSVHGAAAYVTLQDWAA
jgi:hypothetical protein